MKKLNLLKKVTFFAVFAALPFFGMSQEIKVENGNVKVKAGKTAIETKNGNVNVSTNTSTAAKVSTYQTKVGPKNILGNDIKQTITCYGEDVVITGNENYIIIKGYVKSLKLTGNDNKVNLEKVTSIRTLGSDNTIVYKTSPNKNGMASVSTTGSDNEISKH